MKMLNRNSNASLHCCCNKILVKTYTLSSLERILATVCHTLYPPAFRNAEFRLRKEKCINMTDICILVVAVDGCGGLEIKQRFSNIRLTNPTKVIAHSFRGIRCFEMVGKLWHVFNTNTGSSGITRKLFPGKKDYQLEIFFFVRLCR